MDPSTGLLADRVWSNAHVNFDNLWYAIVAIFVVVTLDDWPSLMFQAMDATGVGKQPRLNHQIWASIYFIFLLLMGAVFWANLLAGVVTDCYSKLPPEDKDMLFITESQKRWAQAIKMKRYENQVSMNKAAPPQVTTAASAGLHDPRLQDLGAAVAWVCKLKRGSCSGRARGPNRFRAILLEVASREPTTY